MREAGKSGARVYDPFKLGPYHQPSLAVRVGMMGKGRVYAVASLGAALLFAAAAAPAVVTVEQRGRTFWPGVLSLHPGETATFTNEDPFSHQLYIEADSMHYESGIQDPGATRNITFAKDGTFEVRCAIHPRMRLHVDVH